MQTHNPSTADKLLKQLEDKQKRSDLSKEEYSELRRACKGVFATRNGQILARAMMKMSGIYRFPKNNTNVFAMGEERGREFMYVFLVKSMLSPEQMNQIETVTGD